MPQLPTLEVTSTQIERITAAFGSVTNYRRWLRESVIDYVLASEAADRVAAIPTPEELAAAEASRAAADRAALRAEIPEP